jgi:hypothetical protein
MTGIFHRCREQFADTAVAGCKNLERPHRQQSADRKNGKISNAWCQCGGRADKLVHFERRDRQGGIGWLDHRVVQPIRP